MAAELNLFVNIRDLTLVKGLQSQETFVLPDFFEGADFTVKLWPVTPTDAVSSGPFFSLVPLGNLTAKMVIGSRAGVPAILAAQYNWYPNYDSSGSTGYLGANGGGGAEFNLNTTEMNAAIGNNDSIQSFFEIQLGETGIYRVINQQQCRIVSTVIDPTGVVLPTPSANYLTREECLAMFLKFVGNPSGATIETVSPDGTRHRFTGVNNDGSAKDDLL